MDDERTATESGAALPSSSAAAAMSRVRRHTAHFLDSAVAPDAAPAPPARAAALSSYERIHGRGSRAPAMWQRAELSGPPLQDVIYEKALGEGMAKVVINRPERRNAFRPETIRELQRVFDSARDDPEVGVVIFTGAGDAAFCSGGDQAVRGNGGYVSTADGLARLNVLDLQVQIRRLPKPVIAMVKGYAVGGGHILHMVCDLTIAADNAIFGQTGPKVGSFDAGYGSSIMSRLIGPKRAREMWFLARMYSAQEAMQMGLVNTVVPLADVESETVQWCREILANSPTALRVLKAALNAVDDGAAGLQELGGNATLLFYQTEEGKEGKEAFLGKRKPDWSRFDRLP